MIIRTYNLNRHFLCSPLLFYMVVCPSLSPFTMMKITTYGGRHLSHMQPFLSLSRVLFRARTFLLFNSLSLSNEKTTAAQFQICRAEKLSHSGRVARKRRERSPFFYKSTMKVFQLGGTYHKFSAKLGEMPSPRLIVIKIPLKWQRGASLVLK